MICCSTAFNSFGKTASSASLWPIKKQLDILSPDFYDISHILSQLLNLGYIPHDKSQIILNCYRDWKVVVLYERKRSGCPAYSCALPGSRHCRQYSGESVRSGTIYNLQYVEYKKQKSRCGFHPKDMWWFRYQCPGIFWPTRCLRIWSRSSGKRKDGEAVSEETTSPPFYSAKYRGLPTETKPSLPVMTTLL